MSAQLRFGFLAANVVVWLIMTALLVVVPDFLEPRLGIELSSIIGWAVACGVWVVVLESSWKQRVGPFVRFGLQLGLWVSAALVASWIREQARWSF